MKLVGLRVVDFSPSTPGALVARMLADHGAEVLKVEPPGGSPLRVGPAALVRFTERGKDSIVLDLKVPTQRQKARELAEAADVLVESNRPGVMERLGLGYAALSASNPRLVYASISAFGQHGPLQPTPAHDLSVRAFAGGLKAGDDTIVPATMDASLAGAYLALAGVLMAVHAVRTTGRGDWLDLSLHDVALTLQSQNLPDQAGAPARRPLRAAFQDVYRTSDGRWLCLAGREPAFVSELLHALNLPDLIPTAADSSAAAQDRVRMALAACFSQSTQAEWIQWFKGRNVAFAPVLDYGEAIRHPHVSVRNMCLEDEEGALHLNTPLHFRNEPAAPVLRVPSPGERLMQEKLA